ncbi:hypothetical protein FAF44_35110 [Nonomuraea sp. MG754425]|uniref:hypothetical protein n=1 Tax=Nonomuraea sp. MG754425 TaxID=2570319 RepID=UPI001F1A17DC|nr:hypothetical protein [Nonomuraea sp. MG754425]MCF6473578.1 hypothetical protein [Nonomuraea sp. MG754425]
MKTAALGLALGLAALTGPAVAQSTGLRPTAALMDDPCGHYTMSGTEYYRNCNKDTSEKIWVTYRISAHNQHFCVPAREKVELGYYLNVYGVYHDSWGC